MRPLKGIPDRKVQEETEDEKAGRLLLEDQQKRFGLRSCFFCIWYKGRDCHRFPKKEQKTPDDFCGEFSKNGK